MSAQPRELRAPADRPVRLGFVGLGWIGRTRLDAIAADTNLRIAALHDQDPSRLASAAALHADALAARDLEQLLAADLDGVVIATPNGCHAQQALAALERGHAVFCQKPLAVNAQEARRIVAAAEQADRMLAVDYCYRHVAGMQDLRTRLRAGELGDVLGIDLVFHNAYGPDKAWCRERALAGGGCVLDLGVHLLDLALWLRSPAVTAAGAPPLELLHASRYAGGTPLAPGDAALEDLAFATWRDAAGTTVRLACSWHAQIGTDARIELRMFGTRGGAVWRNVGGSFYDFELQVVHGARAHVLARGPDEWGARALRDWIARVRRGERFASDAHEYVTGAALVDAVYAS